MPTTDQLCKELGGVQRLVVDNVSNSALCAMVA